VAVAVADAAVENRYAEPDWEGSRAFLEDRRRLGEESRQPPAAARRAGAVHSTAAGDILMAFDEVRAMIWRLMNPRAG